MQICSTGGTVDITVHEVLDGGKLKELHAASGGDWGGANVDSAFRQMLIKLFSNPILKQFQNRFMDDYLDIFRDFEIKKRDLKPAGDSKITIRVPITLKQLFEDETEEFIQEAIDQSSYKGQMTFTGDKLRIDPSVFRHMFDSPIENIVEHVSGLLRDPSTRGTTSILMVGGFSESVMLQTAIKNTFPQMTVIVPEGAGLVVLKGAVIFGHDPNGIAKRICRHTYGIEINSPFDATHDTSKRFVSDGRAFCKEVFDKHVEIGQSLNYGEVQSERTYAPLADTDDTLDFVLYASDQRAPRYVTEKGCQRIGKLTVKVGDKSVPLHQRTLCVSLTFSGTEIVVRANEQRTGKVTDCKLNFLD